MKASTLFRASILAAAFGAALSAQAVTINLSSSGSMSSATSFSETVTYQSGGYGVLSALNYTVAYSATPNALGGNYSGMGTYSGAGGTLKFSFLVGQPTTFAGTSSFSGAWTSTSGTGTYSVPAGSGTLGLVFNTGSSPTSSMTGFSGNVQAVPEPASCAVLGLGALGLLRRRRKA